jgi:hypothetical protein
MPPPAARLCLIRPPLLRPPRPRAPRPASAAAVERPRPLTHNVARPAHPARKVPLPRSSPARSPPLPIGWKRLRGQALAAERIIRLDALCRCARAHPPAFHSHPAAIVAARRDARESQGLRPARVPSVPSIPPAVQAGQQTHFPTRWDHQRSLVQAGWLCPVVTARGRPSSLTHNVAGAALQTAKDALRRSFPATPPPSRNGAAARRRAHRVPGATPLPLGRVRPPAHPPPGNHLELCRTASSGYPDVSDTERVASLCTPRPSPRSPSKPSWTAFGGEKRRDPLFSPSP